MIERLRRSDTAVVALWFLFTRLLVVAAAFFGAAHPNPGYRLQSLGGPAAPALLEPFVRWDAAYYIDLARNGYPPPGSTPVYHAAFFPLYPMLIRTLDADLHDTVLSAILISNACALGAALLLCRLSGGRAASFLLLAAPGAGFLSFPYSESLFCLLVAGGLLAVMSSRPLLAASLGALASASRPTGVVVAVALLVHAWQKRGDLRQAGLSTLSALLAMVGLIAFALFCRNRYGDPLYFAHLQSSWGRHASLFGPFQAFAEFRFDPDYYLVALVAIGGAIWMWGRSPVLSACSWFLILLPLSTGSLKSIIRFQSANVPLLAGMGAVAVSGRAKAIVLTGSLALMIYETARYAQGFAHN